MRRALLAIVVAVALAPLAACSGSGRGPSECPGGRTTDGDCCRTGCACGASCISCSHTCRRIDELSEMDAGRR